MVVCVCVRVCARIVFLIIWKQCECKILSLMLTRIHVCHQDILKMAVVMKYVFAIRQPQR